MHLQKLLTTRLKLDIIKELELLYDNNTTLWEKIDKETYLCICKIKLKNSIKNIQFLNQTTIECKYPPEDRCCARIWNHHYGDRCRYKKIKNNDYCNHHLNVIQRYGKLVFNRYDENKPLYNIKQNKILWFSNSHIEILNDIIQKQHNNLYRKIKIDSIK